MAYSITDRQLYNSMQYTLLETPNNGASYGSGLYTAAEVASRTNQRLDLFNKLTAIHAKNNVTDAVTANVRNQTLTNLVDLVDMLEVSYKPTSTWNVLPPGSATEADSFLGDQVGSDAAQSLPFFYAIEVAPLLEICLYPPPSSAGTLRMAYVPTLDNLSTTPDGTTIRLPDDFTPFIKFGVLADLFNKSGEAYDPVRAQLCEALFQLGVQTAQSWVSGEQV